MSASGIRITIEFRGDLSTRQGAYALAYGARMIAHEVTDGGETEAKDVERCGLSFTWTSEPLEKT